MTSQSVSRAKLLVRRLRLTWSHLLCGSGAHSPADSQRFKEFPVLESFEKSINVLKDEFNAIEAALAEKACVIAPSTFVEEYEKVLEAACDKWDFSSSATSFLTSNEGPTGLGDRLVSMGKFLATQKTLSVCWKSSRPG